MHSYPPPYSRPPQPPPQYGTYSHYPQHPQQPYPSYPPGPYYPHDRMQVVQVAPQTYAKGKQLVFWSRMLVLIGFLVGFAGCGSLAVMPAGAQGPVCGLGILLACITVIAAAVVGTIGRRMQGRIV
jgi:hypothetical protein